MYSPPMSTLLKGRITEAALLEAFVRRDHAVLVPFGEGQSYDLAVDLHPGVLRVQCKTARPCPGGLLFNCRTTDHGRGPASYVGLADVFGVYYEPMDRVYLVPVGSVSPAKAILRLEPTRNNQKLGIRLAADYEIDRWTDEELRALIRAGVPLHVDAAS
jgi:hypothetical protein